MLLRKTLSIKILRDGPLGRSAPAATDLAEVWPRGATPCLRSGEVAERKYPMSEVRGGGQEELPTSNIWNGN